MLTVKVLKFAGETGLRKVGTIYSEYDKTAVWLLSKGLVALITDGTVTIKEDKTLIETKELKITRTTKKRK